MKKIKIVLGLFIAAFLFASCGGSSADVFFKEQDNLTCQEMSAQDYFNAKKKYSKVSDVVKDGLILVSDPNYYGYINVKGEEVIKCQYKFAHDFENGLAKVALDGDGWSYLYGLINTKGEVVLPIEYASIGEFYNGVACIGKKVDEGILYGIVDEEGKLVLEPKMLEEGYVQGFVKMSDFKGGLAMVKDEYDNYGFINPKGEKLDLLKDMDGYRVADVVGFEKDEDYALVYYVHYEEDSQFNVIIDREGNHVFTVDYSEYQAYGGCTGDFIILGKKEGRYDSPKYGLINIKGEEILPCKYVSVGKFCEGLALVEEKEFCGYVNEKGEFEIPCKYDKGYDFADGVAWVVEGKRDAKVKLIDTDGKELFTLPEGYYPVTSFVNGVACVRGFSNLSFVDKSGNIISEWVSYRGIDEEELFEENGFQILD
jgi:hypothetical protein